MKLKITCGKCGEIYDMQNIIQKKSGFSFDLFHADTINAKTQHCKRIGQHLQGYILLEEDKGVENYLKELANGLEPKTHCCECTPGDYYSKHFVHIQYPKCNCDPKKYILKVN